MIEGFDVRTLALTNLLLGVVLGLGLLTFSRAHPSFKGFHQLGYGYLLLALSFLLIGLRHYISDWLSVIISNTVLLISIATLGCGLLSFFKIKRRAYIKLSTVLTIILVPVFIYFTFLNENVNFRIITASIFVSLQFIYLAFKLAVHFKEQEKSINNQFIKVLYLTFLLAGLFFIFRVVWTFSESHLDNYMNAGVIHALAILIFQLVIVITGFAVSWGASDKLANELELQATIDPLTQTFNRRALEGFAKKEISLAKRLNNDLVVIIMDIDDFKIVNDEHGHLAGDQVLIEFTRRLKENLREYDVLARFGGEEFLLLLPDTKANIALTIAEKLRKTIAAPVFLLNKNLHITITASFGIAINKGRKIVWQELLSQADKALYQAKAAGKNKVNLQTAKVITFNGKEIIA